MACLGPRPAMYKRSPRRCFLQEGCRVDIYVCMYIGFLVNQEMGNGTWNGDWVLVFMVITAQMWVLDFFV